MTLLKKCSSATKLSALIKSRLMEKLECKSLMDLYTFAQRNKIG
ncbi:DNA-binding transcriptional activator EvgA [Escherichia coli]|uniref:DNA-binding transcriptional activator EvgA n=1 Tax=Escherichia coli TaxID=562 RepID=A0A2X3JTC5_ECOLX|nr:DNA-binding transcriptional activator EvgA [Escherichia coli]